MMDGEIKQDLFTNFHKITGSQDILNHLHSKNKEKIIQQQQLCHCVVGVKKERCMCVLRTYVFVQTCACACVWRHSYKKLNAPPLLGVESELEQYYVAVFPQWKPVPGFG